MVGAGLSMPTKNDGKRYIVHSDELLTAFLLDTLAAFGKKLA